MNDGIIHDSAAGKELLQTKGVSIFGQLRESFELGDALGDKPRRAFKITPTRAW
jgi:hypothetical protein